MKYLSKTNRWNKEPNIDVQHSSGLVFAPLKCATIDYDSPRSSIFGNSNHIQKGTLRRPNGYRNHTMQWKVNNLLFIHDDQLSIHAKTALLFGGAGEGSLLRLRLPSESEFAGIPDASNYYYGGGWSWCNEHELCKTGAYAGNCWGRRQFLSFSVSIFG